VPEIPVAAASNATGCAVAPWKAPVMAFTDNACGECATMCRQRPGRFLPLHRAAPSLRRRDVPCAPAWRHAPASDGRGAAGFQRAKSCAAGAMLDWRVFNPCQLMLLRIGMQRRTRKTKQGSHDLTVTEDGLCRHGGKASDSRAAQQLQEHRFFLVITMVGGEQSVSRLERHCQRRITRASRSRLQPFFRDTCNPYTFNNILNIERGADTCAMPAPLGRGRLAGCDQCGWR